MQDGHRHWFGVSLQEHQELFLQGLQSRLKEIIHVGQLHTPRIVVVEELKSGTQLLQHLEVAINVPTGSLPDLRLDFVGDVVVSNHPLHLLEGLLDVFGGRVKGSCDWHMTRLTGDITCTYLIFKWFFTAVCYALSSAGGEALAWN